MLKFGLPSGPRRTAPALAGAPLKPSQSQFADIRDVRYHIRTWGNPGAPKLFMLHGAQECSASWQFVVDALRADFDTVVQDDILGFDGHPGPFWHDAIARRLPGALSEGSGEFESFSQELDGGLEYPHYTRPAEFRGWHVPDVLLSGDHARIERWRKEHVR